MNRLVMGVDTSCYTTSIAVMNANEILVDRRVKLTVKKGKRGLRQSEAFFQHVENLSMLLTEIKSIVDLNQLQTIGVSTQPRNTKDSYMPVFKAGFYFSKNLSTALGIELKEFSHQEGHIMASLEGTVPFDKPFLVYHLSGGTNELLLTDYQDNRFHSEIVGGSLDITAGQLIDRVGVKAGLAFPCGQAMEQIALSSDSTEVYPVSTKGTYINFSGIESYGLKHIDDDDNFKNIFNSINKSIAESLTAAIGQYNTNNILITGGVSANTFLRTYLNENFDNITFGPVKHATDNALGIAYLTLKDSRDNL